MRIVPIQKQNYQDKQTFKATIVSELADKSPEFIAKLQNIVKRKGYDSDIITISEKAENSVGGFYKLQVKFSLSRNGKPVKHNNQDILYINNLLKDNDGNWITRENDPFEVQKNIQTDIKRGLDKFASEKLPLVSKKFIKRQNKLNGKGKLKKHST